MPVTKTATKALRSAQRKSLMNKKIMSNLEASIRVAQKSKKETDLRKAISLVDRASKKHVIHKNKAARIKSQLSKSPKTKKGK